MANTPLRNLAISIENLENQEEAAIPRQNFSALDPFELNDREFRKNFRLTKDLVCELIALLSAVVDEATRSSSLSVRKKVLVALNFYATGSYQTAVGKNIYLGVSQPSVSRCVKDVTEALNRPEIFNQWVKFPTDLEQLNTLRQGFYNKYEIPGVIGCIDCTHIAIVPPPREEENIYVNRKNYHSINVQLICDHDLRILNVNAKFPGSTHDSHIWNSSNVERLLREIYNRMGEGFFLLGDSGYPLRPWLLTPLQNPQGEIEQNYNNKQKHARATIERCNGVLKNRFRCLLKDRVLHFSPTMCSKITNACVVLHNMCIHNNVELEDEELNFEFEVDVDPQVFENATGRMNPDLVAGRRIQRQLMNRLRRR